MKDPGDADIDIEQESPDPNDYDKFGRLLPKEQIIRRRKQNEIAEGIVVVTRGPFAATVYLTENGERKKMEFSGETAEIDATRAACDEAMKQGSGYQFRRN